MSTCILTDNTALFPTALSSCNGHLRTFPLTFVDGKCQPPSPADFKRMYTELERSFEALLVLTVSEQILPLAEVARQAAQGHGGALQISVLDSQQIGPGLGLLALLGAKAIAAGARLPEIEELLRAALPHIYTLLCPEFDPDGETDEQSNFSIYSIETGALNVYKKVRTRRHLLDALQEFIEEFEKPQQIAYFHGRAPNPRARPLRSEVESLFPETPFTEMEINATLSNLFGPQLVGLTLMELP